MVEIHQARRRFRTSERSFDAGDFVIPLDQPYGAFARTLLENQEYPELRQYPGGPPVRPYDVTAHSLPLLMGVQAFEVTEPPKTDLQPVDQLRVRQGRVGTSSIVALSPDDTRSWTAVNRLLKAGTDVFRDTINGTFYIPRHESLRGMIEGLADEFGLNFRPASPTSTRSQASHTDPRRPLPGLCPHHG